MKCMLTAELSIASTFRTDWAAFPVLELLYRIDPLLIAIRIGNSKVGHVVCWWRWCIIWNWLILIWSWVSAFFYDVNYQKHKDYEACNRCKNNYNNKPRLHVAWSTCRIIIDIILTVQTKPIGGAVRAGGCAVLRANLLESDEHDAKLYPFSYAHRFVMILMPILLLLV